MSPGWTRTREANEVGPAVPAVVPPCAAAGAAAGAGGAGLGYVTTVKRGETGAVSFICALMLSR